MGLVGEGAEIAEGLLKVLVNAMSVREGGPLVVLRLLLTGMMALRPDWRWHLVVNSTARYPQFVGGECEYSVFKWAEQSVVGNYLFYNRTLSHLANRCEADILFSMTNYLPRNSPVPTLLLVQHAGHFSPVFAALTRQQFPDLKSRLAWQAKQRRVFASIRSADLVTVQTAALAMELAAQANISHDKVRAVAHGPGLCEQTGLKRWDGTHQPWRIGFLSNFGVQKNFSDLFKAAAVLRKHSFPITLVLSLPADEPLSQSVLRQANALGLEGIIENHGRVSSERIPEVYDSLDLFVFPSLCESFGFPMLEAMARGLPLIVADVPGNREVAGPHALNYAPGNHEQLATLIHDVLVDEERYSKATGISLTNVQRFSWELAAQQTLGLLDELTAGRQES